MSALKYFKKNEYNSIGEALLDIQKELQSLIPINSDGIKWSRTANGMQANLQTGPGGAYNQQEPTEDAEPVIVQEEVYNGYFKLVDMTEYNEDGTVKAYKVGVVDGKTFDGTTSGPSYIIDPHQTTTEVPAAVVTLPGKGYYCISLCYEYITNSFRVRYNADKFPQSDDSLVFIPIGGVTIDANSGVDIRQMFLHTTLHNVTIDYMGGFKVCRKINDDNTISYLVTEGSTDVCGVLPQTSVSNGSVYVCFDLDDEDNIVGSITVNDMWHTVIFRIAHIGTVVTQEFTAGSIRLAGSYVI